MWYLMKPLIILLGYIYFAFLCLWINKCIRQLIGRIHRQSRKTFGCVLCFPFNSIVNEKHIDKFQKKCLDALVFISGNIFNDKINFDREYVPLVSILASLHIFHTYANSGQHSVCIPHYTRSLLSCYHRLH